MTLDYVIRPLRRPVPITGIDPNFKASWSDTLDVLAREARELEADRVILEADVEEADIRLDGRLRANARPRTPAMAVVLLGTNAGDLRFQAHLGAPVSAPRGRDDAPWQSNVRAIALSLEALRRVDRYGTTPSSEQYSGFKALPAAGQLHEDVLALGRDLIARAGSYRKALAIHHPDNGGSHDDFVAVKAAYEAEEDR